jgi:hypothetical protein
MLFARMVQNSTADVKNHLHKAMHGMVNHAKQFTFKLSQKTTQEQ